MYNRLQLLKVPHGGLRNALGKMCIKASAMDLEDENKLQSFREEFHIMFELLADHSNSEDLYLQPLYELHCPDIARQLEDQHATLDRQLKDLLHMIDQAISSDNRYAVWYEVVNELNRFTADYFQHILFEETEALPAVWEACTDEELFAIHEEVMKAMPPSLVIPLLQDVIPAINPAERFGVLEHIRRTAPTEVFESILQVAQQQLSKDDWESLYLLLQA